MSAYSKIVTSIGCIALLLVAGCFGEPVGTVSGKVTYKGAPVTTGSISFNMKGKGIAQDAKLGAGGEFTMQAPLPAGSYQVHYVPPTPEPQDPSKPRAPSVKSNVPAKFTAPNTSGLTFEVRSGTNDIPIEFKD